MQYHRKYQSIVTKVTALVVALICSITLMAQPMGGNYTINKNSVATTTNYTSFQSFFNALASNGINTNVNVDVVSGSGPYAEQVSISSIFGSTNSAKITVNGNNEVLRFTSASNSAKHTLKFDGADYIVLKNLIIESLGSSYAWGVHFTNNADNNIIENCVVKIKNYVGVWDGIGIVVSASSTNALNSGAAARNLTISSCTITGESNAGPGNGIVINPQSNPAINSRITVQHSQIEGFFSHGIFLTNARGVTLKNNSISRPSRTSCQEIYGIRIVNSNQEDTVISNRIYNCFQSVSGISLTQPFYGVHIENNSLGKLLVANNTIYNNNNLGKWHGVFLACSKDVKIAHNTIYAGGTTNTTADIYGFYHGVSTCNNSAGSEFINNNISIDRVGASNKYGVYQDAGAVTISHNNLFVVGTNAYIGWDGTNHNTLASWQGTKGAGAPFGINSTDVNPNFLNSSTGNLVPQSVGMDNTGKSTIVKQDIVNAPRATNPDVGAFEFDVDANVRRVILNSNYCEGDSDMVSVLVVNNSPTAINDFKIGITFNTNPEYFETVEDTIASNDSLLITLKTKIGFSQIGSNTLFSRIKGKAQVGPNNTVVNSKPHGSKLVRGANFVGFFNGGDSIDPDIIGQSDSTSYEIEPPNGFFNSDYGVFWELSSIDVSFVNNAKSLNTQDTFSSVATAQKNVAFFIVPSTNLIGETLKVVFNIKDISTGCISKQTERYIKIVAKPSSQFSSANACEGEAISFSNLSTGPGILEYKWFFGDGDSSNLIHPQKTYTKPGQYRVKLLTYTVNGFIDSSIAFVTVYDAPDVGFIFKNQCEGIAIDFIDTSTVFNGVSSFSWNFGDGSVDMTNRTLTHLYSSDGFYPVTLTITDSLGCTSQVNKQVTFSKKPIANFSFPTLSCNEKKVAFTNNSASGSSIGYTWFFGDGDSSIARHVEHTYDIEGAYTVTLLARNGFNCIDTAKKTIILLGTPEPNFVPSTTCANQTVVFQNTTKEPLGTTVSYLWTLNSFSTSVSTNPIFTFSSIGPVEVVLKATATNGCEQEIKRTIQFTEKPIADFVIPQNICSGVEYEATNNTILSTGTLSYVWSLGSKSSTLTNPKDSFNSEGKYPIRLIAFSSNGCADTAIKELNVVRIPDSDFISESRKTGDGYMVFTPIEINGVGNYNWVYSFGGGSNLKTKNEVKIPTSGTHTISLQIVNQGCASTTSKKINVDITSVNHVKSNQNIVIYPNPAKQQLFVSTNNGEHLRKVEVYDLNGREVLKHLFNYTLFNQSINISKLKNGVYYFVLTTEKSRYFVKVEILE